MRRRSLPLLALATALLAPAGAATAAPGPGLSLEAQPRTVILAGDTWTARGALRPAAAGRTVVVRYVHRGKLVGVRRVMTNTKGAFRATFRLRALGTVTARATAGELRSAPLAVRALPRKVGFGSSPAAVRALQARLRFLGYVTPVSGSLDGRTSRAVEAFRKSTGLARTQIADVTVMRLLARGAGRFTVRFPRHGRHIEADLSKQVIALIGAGGRVERIYPTSSGAPATPTVRGSFRVYRKDLGTNALGMVHSSYFIRGYAIHGYRSVPTYNASHGCLRVPVPDALSIFSWVRFGTTIDVYV